MLTIYTHLLSDVISHAKHITYHITLHRITLHCLISYHITLRYLILHQVREVASAKDVRRTSVIADLQGTLLASKGDITPCPTL